MVVPIENHTTVPNATRPYKTPLCSTVSCSILRPKKTVLKVKYNVPVKWGDGVKVDRRLLTHLKWLVVQTS